MKRVWPVILLVLTLLAAPACADEAGVLTEAELNAWLNPLLRSTANVQPINAPVGEDALTEDGYAFLYDSATLYYNKPVLDAQSVLGAVAVTSEALDMPRGIRLGAPAEMLMTAYGWQNPALSGDESFAPLYVLDRLPEAAYWALAQRSGDQLLSVQCAIHARQGDGRYTDSGVLYTVQNGVVSAIRVYGLSAAIDLATVQSNLLAVGDGKPAGTSKAAAGVTIASSAEPFGKSDLQFSRMDFLTLTEKGAGVLFGQASEDRWVQDDQGRWLHTLSYPGASLVFASDADRNNARLDSLTLSGDGLSGPRGLRAGMSPEEALALFRCDGNGATAGDTALLYGDGRTPPFGTLERNGEDSTLRYAAAVTGADGASRNIALHLTFTQGRLAELMLYTL